MRVDVVSGPGRAARGAASGLARWLVRAAPVGAVGEVTVALVGDGRVRALNRRYRRADRLTDVLSFPTSTAEPGIWHAVAGPRQLGDIVIATGQASRQARQAGHAFGTEVRILALHGLLHLLGFDHERDGGRMAEVERALRLKGGLREGLIERAGWRPTRAR